MVIRVAVVGAGSVGLIALKNLREDGFDAVAFDKRGYVGGLWKQSQDSSLSVTANTVFNSSRFRSAVSDFPFPDHVDDYPTGRQILQYFEDYRDHFHLGPYLRLNAEVTGLRRVDGIWGLEVLYDGLHTKVEYFDKVLVATTPFSIPKIPKITGIERFQGSVIHSVEFPDQSDLQIRYRGQNVLLIGMHATAQDLTVELAPYANKVYIAHKNGIIMVPRFLEDGCPLDEKQTLQTLFYVVFLIKWFPTLFNWLFYKVLVGLHRKYFPKTRDEWGLLPGPSVATTAPLVADELYPFLVNGFAAPIPAIREVASHGAVILTDDRVLNDIDSIIYCTGYDFAVPFLPQEFNPYPIHGEAPYLYRNIFPLHADPDVRHSLAFLGHSAIPFPGFVQWELNGMAVSQIWQGRTPLPPIEGMKKWHQDHLTWRQSLRSSRKQDSSFFAVFVDFPEHIRWLDATAGCGLFDHFGFFRWRAWQFWWSDPEFYKLCYSGILSPALWRLFNTGRRKAWDDAREQLFKDNKLAKERRDKRVQSMNEDLRKSK